MLRYKQASENYMPEYGVPTKTRIFGVCSTEIAPFYSLLQGGSYTFCSKILTLKKLGPFL